jgi:hypothetical protein
MAEHSLPYGIEIINKLFKLGQLLGYHCEKEYPVDKENESAVDVAWLFEPEQKYPLFIFEVESKTTNSIPANPLKIFGETNQKFEKPLFLFHLLLTGGKESKKIQQLERTYGTYNYRIYRFRLEEEISLIKDILSQHRRLTNKLKIVELIKEVMAGWKEIDISSIILHIEELEYEKNTGLILPAYATLSKTIPLMRDHFIRRLKQKAGTPNGLFSFESYGSYLGTEWSIPVHLGMLSAFAEDGMEEKYFLDFKNWQEKSYYLKQIGASYGLSRDYDIFILGMSGAVLSLTGILFYKVAGAREYVSNELLGIIKKSDRFDFSASIYNCLWLLHLCSDSENGRQHFEFVRNLVNENGGIPELLYLNPPIDFVGILEGDETIESFGNLILIPTWEDFKLAKQKRKVNPEILFDLGINYLTEDENGWNPMIAEQI